MIHEPPTLLELETVVQVAGLKGPIQVLTDMTIGCDQYVYACQLEQFKVVIKRTKKEHDKVEKQAIMSKICLQLGICVAKVLYFDLESGYLIEEWIEGHMLSEQLNNQIVWICIGRQMKSLHSVKGSSYSYKIDGQHTNKFQSYCSVQERQSGVIDSGDLSGIQGIQKYFKQVLDGLKVVQPVFLHYDIGKSNIIVKDSDAYFIDFGDAGMGHPMEDFAILKIQLWNSPQKFNLIIQGYGNISLQQLKLIDFFCLLRLTWALPSDDRKQKYLSAAAHIVNEYLAGRQQNLI